jgi:hypothetical protein
MFFLILTVFVVEVTPSIDMPYAGHEGLSLNILSQEIM